MLFINSSNSLFRLVVPIEERKEKITPSSSIFLMGSCFTENIGEKFSQAGFYVEVNPFGIVYNPISIAFHIERLIRRKLYTSSDIYLRNELYHTFDHHSSFSKNSAEELLLSANETLLKSADILQNANYLFITLGTSFVYKYKATGEVVANNHKYPDSYFEQKLLEVEDIVLAFSNVITLLKEYCPTLKVVFSISPIRHFRDGIQANTISKSTLSIAISKLQKVFSQIDYFPAFELVMDELRDYRFYSDDMLHVNNLAVNYIWNRLQDSYLSPECLQMEREYQKIYSDLNHRPFNENSAQYQLFLSKLKLKIESYYLKYPHRTRINLMERYNDISQSFA